MVDKVSHDEISARGGRSRSEAKLEAVARNLAKAREALNARRAARTESGDKTDNCGQARAFLHPFAISLAPTMPDTGF